MKLNCVGVVSAVLITLAGVASAENETGGVFPREPGLTADADEWPRPGEKPSTVGIFVEPLLAAFGFYEGDILVGVSDKLAVGASGQYFDYKFGSLEFSGFGFGVGAEIFPLDDGQTFDGFYVYPSVKYFKATTTIEGTEDAFGNSDDEVAEVTYVGPQVLVGYHWDWHPFSVRLGGGLEYSFGEFDTAFSDDSGDLSGLGFESDLTIGLTF